MEYPIAVILTDTHLKRNNIELVEFIFKQAVDVALEHKCQFIIHAGDFFDSREALPMQTLQAARRIEAMLVNAHIHMLIIPGNHDKTSYTSSESFLDIFTNSNHIHVSNEPKLSHIEGIPIMLAPYFKERGGLYQSKMQAVLSTYSSDIINKTILITHIAVNGALNNDKSEVSDAVPISFFKQFKQVYSGHYHNHQIIDNFTYVGSAFQANFGETHQDKGFHVLCSDGFLVHVPSVFPQYITHELDIDDSQGLKDLETQLKQKHNDHIRLKLYGEPEAVESFNKSRLIDLGATVIKQTNISSIEAPQEFSQYDASKIEQMFNSFCNTKKISPNKEILEIFKSAIS